MKVIDQPIVVLSRNLCRNDVLKERLKTRFSKVKFNEEGIFYKGSELIDFLKGATGLIVGQEPIDEAVLSACPELKFISKYGVGLNNLDIPAIEKRGVKWLYSPGVNRRSVAEMAIGFMLTLLNNSYSASLDLRQGQWKPKGGTLLTGKTVGIIGFGYIGRDVAGLLRSFGCKFLIHDILNLELVAENFRAIQVSKEELLKNSDVVTIHVPYDTSTHNLITEKELLLMKDDAILINTSRGSIVDEEALYSLMLRGKLKGAASDVFAKEPIEVSPLFTLPHFFPTPHMGGASREAVQAMGTAAVDNLIKLMS